MQRFRPITDRFAAARSGSVGIIFGLTVLPAIALVGLGIDYSRSIAAKASLDASADAAALGAATLAQSTMQAWGSDDDGIGVAVATGRSTGAKVFGANSAKVGAWIGGVPTPTVTVAVNGSRIDARVTYRADVPTTFGKMFGVQSLPIGNTVAASLTLPTYMNISVAVDVSQSMGLAATSADMTKLQSLTPDGCAFGCHVVSSDQLGGPAPYNTTPYRQIAKTNNVQLRVDVIQAATINMIDTAKNLQGAAGMISFGLYNIQGGVTSPLTVLSASSTNYNALKTAAQGIDLGPNVSGGVGDTDFAGAMPVLSGLIPTSGNGLSASNAQQFVFLMTDGVQDVNSGPACLWGHCVQAFNPSLCTSLKNKGVTVGVIYTTYLKMPGDPRYMPLVAPIDTQIAPNLQSCASAGWYYEASDATDIQRAIDSLFARATARGVLTQ